MNRAVDFYRATFPGAPTFTEANVPDLSGKVYLVTGANSGVGKELTALLYGKNAKIYCAARNEEKTREAIQEIKSSSPDSQGALVFMKLDLADLTTIKASAQQFLDAETRLDVLFNNAGVMVPEPGSTTAQGYDLQLGVNNIGTFMLTRLLTPTLQATAKSAPKNAVRVVWVGSTATEAPTLPKDGVEFDNLDYHEPRINWYRYFMSKAGNFLHAAEMARRHREDGIISVCVNPGNLNSNLWRTQNWAVGAFLRTFILHKPIYGAYTELFAGLSPDVTPDMPGDWIVPWGRIGAIKPSLARAVKTKEQEGGTGAGIRFWDWTEEQIKPYV